MPSIAQRLVPAYGRWIICWRWPVVIAGLLAAVAAASGMRHLETTADYRVYFSEDNPQLNVSVANSYSRGDREFEKVTAMPFPSKVAQRGRISLPFRLPD